MAGFQFAHMQNFSRKGDKGGRTVSFVLAEARRDPVASLHVLSPQPPAIVWGCSIEDLEREHDVRVGVARKTIAGGKTRSVGKEQHTLRTIVVSHPYTVEEVEADPAKRQEVERWEALNVEWARRELGDDLRAVIRHTDERQWHLHIYGLPGDPEMRASRSHPGQVAKSDVLAAGPAEGEDDKAMRRRSDRAYKNAMREWQDGYFRAVGMPAGLTRLGPAQRRLSRGEWHQERHQAQALKAAQEEADALKAKASIFARQVGEKAASIRADAARKADAAEAAIAAAKAAKAEVDRLRSEAEARAAAALKAQNAALRDQRQARTMMEKVRAEAARVRGVGGFLRGVWDGLKRSTIADRIREELRPTVERWQQAEAAAAARAVAESDRRVKVEKRASALSASAAELGAQRDELRARLARYEPADVAPVLTRRHP
ncbi:hypothetical protein ASE23_06640 [Rhizobium sp. Root73]|uniref:hypothetical protein n=1 Tax=unclassified Rhizobium TaxID=2613769 RepID=UPI00072729E1|nr:MULTISPECIES: hypothetical protein [unclassified Rhizobium]KQY10814.1 hypothetical protein ASD36_08875 [Rhizobium sp. Root1334]KRC04798.1 hypothetical protein ASE23_06640 [Rhizobium sp. Root73]